MRKGQNTSGEALEQEVVGNYQKIKKRNSLISFVLLIVLLISSYSWVQLIADDEYPQQKAAYTKQLAKLDQEREAILSGKKATVSQSFTTTLNENLAKLKEYPQQADNYKVAIKGTEGQLTLNKNNIFVSDNAKMLSSETKQKIYQLNKQLAASTNGAQLEVVTVSELPRGEDIESYANTIFNQLGIGDKNENNGVLYLISLSDKEFRLEVGYGLEGLIPDGKADDLINDDNVVDDFKDGNYDQAVGTVVNNVFNIMNTKTALVDSQIKKVKSEQTELTATYWGSIVIVGFIIVASIVMIINLIRGRILLKEKYLLYQTETAYSQSNERWNQKIKNTELYFILLSGILLAKSKRSVEYAVAQGNLLRNPAAKKQMLGRILIGDTLYAGNGDILTTAYLASNYNTSNWSNNNGGSGGGSSWGSFGGGSSGGGGASGGW
ncbi:TPM domain-containing protein [Enterococcus hailinensis]|uniref:TPM domain-containing protein n=1 Tax=Enterococcus hailinensis TaxID=3238988 RepID=UPI0038B2B139